MFRTWGFPAESKYLKRIHESGPAALSSDSNRIHLPLYNGEEKTFSDVIDISLLRVARAGW